MTRKGEKDRVREGGGEREEGKRRLKGGAEGVKKCDGHGRLQLFDSPDNSVRKNQLVRQTLASTSPAPLYFSRYMSCCTGTWRILEPYAHRMALVSRNKSIPFALDCSKNIL